MKFTVAALLATLATACFAQRANISYPINGTTVTPGSKQVVQIVQPNSLSSFEEVAVVIGILPCSTGSSCPPPSEALGTILYNGPFKPKFPPPSHEQPQQNFTVTIPSMLPKGHAQLSLFHVFLVGADNEPITETIAISLNVV